MAGVDHCGTAHPEVPHIVAAAVQQLPQVVRVAGQGRTAATDGIKGKSLGDAVPHTGNLQVWDFMPNCTCRPSQKEDLQQIHGILPATEVVLSQISTSAPTSPQTFGAIEAIDVHFCCCRGRLETVPESRSPKLLGAFGAPRARQCLRFKATRALPLADETCAKQSHMKLCLHTKAQDPDESLAVPSHALRA